MRFMFFVRRSVSTISAAAMVMAFVGRAHGGERLSLEELAQRTDGAAVVRVDLGGSGTAKVLKILRGPLPPDLGASPSWLSLCLPRRDDLKKWQIQHSHWKAKSLWRLALRRGHYDAVVFVKKYPTVGWEPHCGLEAMEMAHTDLHPNYAGYAAAVAAVAAAKAEPKQAEPKQTP